MGIELKRLMENLESTLNYFASIPARGNIDYEEGYHAEVIDPDGKSRNLLDERESALQGCSEIVDFLRSSKPGKILDFGCGLGWVLSALDDSWDRHGLETSKFAAKHAETFGSIFQGDYRNYTESGFDYVVLNHVIEHLPDPVGCLRLIAEKLNLGGKLILGTPNFDSAAARRYGSGFRLLADPTHISLFSEDSIRRLVRDTGFRIDFVEYPFFNTPWFNEENMLLMMKPGDISPPFYGSVLTIFATKVAN